MYVPTWECASSETWSSCTLQHEDRGFLAGRLGPRLSLRSTGMRSLIRFLGNDNWRQGWKGGGRLRARCWGVTGLISDVGVVET